MTAHKSRTLCDIGKVEYAPIKGFYDLREFNIPKKIFAKFHNIQLYLKHVEDHKRYFKEHNLAMWQEAQTISANYQRELFSYDRITTNISQ